MFTRLWRVMAAVLPAMDGGMQSRWCVSGSGPFAVGAHGVCPFYVTPDSIRGPDPYGHHISVRNPIRFDISVYLIPDLFRI